MFRTNKASSFAAAALRGIKCAVEAKGSSWSQTVGGTCGWAGKRLTPKPGLGNPRDGVCQLWWLARAGGPRQVVARDVSFLTQGLKGLVGSHAMWGSGAGRGCCWMFLPSKETPEPGQALLLIQGKKTGSGEKQPVSF